MTEGQKKVAAVTAVAFPLIAGAVFAAVSLSRWARRTYTAEHAAKVRRQQEEAEAARLQNLLRQ
ncbi:MAG: hypothetical protein IT405_01960 [Candidatus Yanofskybacteria bacterium]|nr:hypothetical protein [Candidatus Yanofskybacteria bacterium]